MVKSWLVRNRTLVHWSVPILFAIIAILTGFEVYRLEHAEVKDEALIFIVALIVPSSVSVVIICEIVLLWFYDVWLLGINDIRVTPMQSARDFAELRRDVVRRIKPGMLTRPIYCTTHCNFFAHPDGRTGAIQSVVKDANEELFALMANIVFDNKDDPNNYGGLKLMLHYDQQGSGEDELRKIVGIFSKEAGQSDWNWHLFDVRRVLEGSVKDYLVIEDHVFKTIRKTRASNETQYIYIRSAAIAATYRSWLADLFEFGEGRETERDNIREKVTELKREPPDGS